MGKQDDIESLLKSKIKERLESSGYISIDEICAWSEDENADNINKKRGQEVFTKTYGVVISNFDNALSNEKIEHLQEKVEQIIDSTNFYICINPTPYNSICRYSPVIYVIDSDEDSCLKTIEKIEALLIGMNYEFDRFSTYLIWKDGKGLYIEYKLSKNNCNHEIVKSRYER